MKGLFKNYVSQKWGCPEPPLPPLSPSQPASQPEIRRERRSIVPRKVFAHPDFFFALNILLSIISWTCLGNHWSFWKLSGLSGKLTDFLERFWIGEKSWEEGSVGGSPGAGRKSNGGTVPHSWEGRPWCRAERVGGSAWPHSETIVPWFAAILSCATSCLSIGLSLTRYNKRVKRVRAWGTPHQ